MPVRFLFLIVVLLGASGCGVRHIAFTEQMRAHAADDDVVRLYVDMHGDLYPDNQVVPDAAVIQREETLQNAMRAQRLAACGLATLAAEDAAACEAAASGRMDAWDAAQQGLWARAGARVGGRLGSSGRPLVMLIHGFNTDDAEPVYAAARERVIGFIGDRKPLFVQVHWDGYKGVRRHAWASGQYSGPLVGQRLRALFNALPPDTPVRVLTHSSGGFIVASTFGDATAALPRAWEAERGEAKQGPYLAYVRNAAATAPGNPLRIPNMQDVRLGMLVAASPPDSFIGNRLYPDAGFKLAGATLIFGVNPYDQTIRKGFWLEQLSALGATTLGSRPQAACDVRLALARNPGATVEVLDVSDAPDEWNPGMFGMLQSHKWDTYLKRKRFDDFARRWLALGPAPAFACESKEG